MKYFKSFSFVLSLATCFFVLNGFSKAEGNQSTTPYQTVEELEREFASRLSSSAKDSDSEGILLIGFQTMNFPESEWSKMLELNSMKESMPKGNVDFYVAENGSHMRTYFLMPEGVIRYHNSEHFADTYGIVTVNAISVNGQKPDLGEIQAVGVKKSDMVRGTVNNIVTEDVVYYSKALKASVVYDDLNAVFFDLGERGLGCRE